MDAKKNVPLIIALSIPVLMVILVAVSIYLPAAFFKPQTDFVYMMEGDYYCRSNTYSTQMGKIIVTEINQGINNQNCKDVRTSRLFYYDVTKDIATEITYEKAAGLVVDDSLLSPDGFEIAAGGGGSDFFFSSGYDYYNRYLKKGSYSRRLKAVAGQPYYYNNFKFLGWVKGGDHHG